MAGEYTRSGARRAGDDFQDIVALDLMVDWLRYPDRYEAMHVEEDGVGALDDVTALRKGGGSVYRQVKFATDADDLLDWERLLARKQGKKDLLPSLLMRWWDGLKRAEQKGAVEDVALVTNRRPEPDIASLLSGEGILDFDAIRDPSVQKEIEIQLGGVDNARHFFSQFRFVTDEAEHDAYEARICQQFRSLGFTDHGWHSLKDQVRRWVRLRNQPPPDGTITLTAVRNSALWTLLQSLPQNFEVPSDYVLPSEPFFQEVVQSIQAKQRECLVVTAPPGTGKSSFTSYLFEQLRNMGVPVIRHHYYLAMRDDRTQSTRLGHRRAAESLLSDILADYPESLKELASKSPDPSKLGDYLEKSGQYFASEEWPLVIILDGLDHVWRENSSVEELRLLLEHLLPVPEGVVVVLATQPLDEAQLPAVLSRHAPRENWLGLPSMDLVALRRWLHHHEDDIAQPDGAPLPPYFREQLEAALMRSTSGHPLHLRYTLRALQEQGMAITAETVDALPACPHEDVKEYYRSLMMTLSEAAKDILNVLAATRFSWESQNLIACLSPVGYRADEVREAFKSVKHLLVSDDLGWRPFHSSLPAYLREQPDYGERKIEALNRVLAWLRTEAAPDQVRWGNEWLIASALGDDNALIMEPTRGWAVEAIAKRRTWAEIDHVLNRATFAALQRQETLSQAIRLGVLHDYTARVFDEHADVISRLLPTQLLLDEDTDLKARLLANTDSLTAQEVAAVGVAEANANHPDTVRRCTHTLRRHLRHSGEKQDRFSDWRLSVVPLLRVLVTGATADMPTAINFAVRNENFTRDLLGLIGLECRTNGSMKSIRDGVRECTSASLSPQIQAEFVEHAILRAAEDKVNLLPAISEPVIRVCPIAAIYAALHVPARVAEVDWNFPLPAQDRLTFGAMDQWDFPGRTERLLRNVFMGFLANHTIGNATANQQWREAVTLDGWIGEFVDALDNVTARIAHRLLNREAITLAWIYEQLTSIRCPRWPEERDDTIIDVVQAVERVIYQVSFDMLLLASLTKPVVSKDHLEAASESPFFDARRWLSSYLGTGRIWLATDAVSWLLETLSNPSGPLSSLSSFSERAEFYGDLAALAARHGLLDDSRRLLRDAAENLIAHGYHKDIPFYACLAVIESCHKAGMVDEARTWIASIAPAIAAVDAFTDGRETRHLPHRLAETLATIWPERLPDYYLWLTERGEFYDAEFTLHVILRCADLSDPIVRGVAGTAVDRESLGILKSRADAGDAEAAKIVDTFRQLYGHSAIPTSESPPESKRERTREFVDATPTPDGFPPPSGFVAYLDTCKAGYFAGGEQYAKRWMEYWRSQGQAEAAFDAVKDVAERRPFHSDYGDLLYQYALELYGIDEAFPWLVRAQTETYGWQEYVRGRFESEARWEAVRLQYPERWFEFIRATISGAGGEWQRGVFMSHQNVARLVDFCLLLGQPETARMIAQSLVVSVKELVSPLHLPDAVWANEETV